MQVHVRPVVAALALGRCCFPIRRADVRGSAAANHTAFPTWGPLGRPALIAVIDEATLEHASGFVYVIAAVAIVDDAERVRSRLSDTILRDGRTNPMHWHKEGPRARESLCDIADEVAAVGVVLAANCGRSGQEAARSRNLLEAFTWISAEGVVDVIIEARGHSGSPTPSRVGPGRNSRHRVRARAAPDSCASWAPSAPRGQAPERVEPQLPP